VVSIEWEYETPRIDVVADVPGDQGGQVTVRWTRTGYDRQGSPSRVTEYGVYRRVDPARAAAGASEAASRSERWPRLASQEARFAGRYPPGNWDFIVSVPACCEEEYAIVAPTLSDSTEGAGTHYSVFFVTALTDSLGIRYDSPPDSGYSVDNLVPHVPGGFAVAYAANENDLSWDESPDDDFDCFRVYRGLDPEFDASPENLVHSTVGTSWTDAVPDGWQYHYKISAVDLAGNESDATPPESVTGLDDVLPKVLRLHQNTPNPIRGSTTITYDVPVGGAHVRLQVFDISGRLVRTLLEGDETPGRKRSAWDGRDERGLDVASGVYYYRLETDDGVLTRKTVLLR
jgi:hypothetical protein